MRQQTFIRGIAVLAAVWALGARAQHSGMPTDCGSIGVQVRPMTAAFAYSLGMTEIYGAIFEQPKRGVPAATAGIEAGDVVTAINGSPLSNWKDFAPTISMMAPGTTVYLDTWRDGQLIVASVTLGFSNCPGNPVNGRQRHATSTKRR